MSLFSRNNTQSRKQSGNTDPAHAFGSEAQLMEEFRRQEYIQPSRKDSVLSGIRDRLSAFAARPHETDAPVYSADTYSDDNAPDLGWEAAFDPEASRRIPQPDTSGPSGTQDSFERFRNTVYSSPVRSGSSYSFGSYTHPAPVYEEISVSGPSRRETASNRPVYEEISFGRQPVRETSPMPAPVYEDLTPGLRENYPSIMGPVTEERPRTDRDPVQREVSPSAAEGHAARASDLQYMFWSGTILAGVVLTLFSFIYACAM